MFSNEEVASLATEYSAMTAENTMVVQMVVDICRDAGYRVKDGAIGVILGERCACKGLHIVDQGCTTSRFEDFEATVMAVVKLGGDLYTRESYTPPKEGGSLAPLG